MHAGAHSRKLRRAAVVEPYVMQRTRTAEVLERQGGLEVVHASDSMAALMTWMRGQDRSNWPHLLVVDLLPLRPGDRDVAAVTALREAGMRVLLLSGLSPRRSAQRVAVAGVDGIVSKLDAEQTFLECVAAALVGEPAVSAVARAAISRSADAPDLSPQEAKVLALYVDGSPIAAVAEQIGVRPDTARKYLARVKQKYASMGRTASTKLDLARLAYEDGFIG